MDKCQIETSPFLSEIEKKGIGGGLLSKSENQAVIMDLSKIIYWVSPSMHLTDEPNKLGMGEYTVSF